LEQENIKCRRFQKTHCPKVLQPDSVSYYGAWHLSMMDVLLLMICAKERLKPMTSTNEAPVWKL
jgi:hypothetical protein